VSIASQVESGGWKNSLLNASPTRLWWKFSTWTGLFLDEKLFAVDLMQVSTLLTLGRRARSLH